MICSSSPCFPLKCESRRLTVEIEIGRKFGRPAKKLKIEDNGACNSVNHQSDLYLINLVQLSATGIVQNLSESA
jgi:hypothetical protein